MCPNLKLNLVYGCQALTAAPMQRNSAPPPSPSPFVDTALAETRQGWYKRAYQRGLDGFRSNAEDSQEEGEGGKFDGVSNCLAIL
jgi:hypothetical protein